MNLQKLNIKYPKTFLAILNSENTCYNFLKMFLDILYSLDFFQTYKNVPMIYLKHYCKSTCKNFNINLPFKIIKILAITFFMDFSIVFRHNHNDGIGELDKAKTKHVQDHHHHHHLQFSISN